MGMDLDLSKLLIKTINIRRVTDVSAGQTATLGTAIPVLVYLETVDDTARHTGGGREQKPTHWFTTKDWPTDLPGGPKYDDRVWLPGADTNDISLGKMPQTIEEFNDPELGDVDHYEVTL